MTSAVLAIAIGGMALLGGGCGLTTVRPKREMAMAQAAFLAAKKADSHKHSPKIFKKAEYYYLKAKHSYRRKYFNKARQYALLSQKFSEKSESISVTAKILGAAIDE